MSKHIWSDAEEGEGDPGMLNMPNTPNMPDMPDMPDMTDMINACRTPLQDAKVMMVDDDPLLTDLIQAHLEDAGYANFVVTNNPLDAMSLLRAEDPGVLLLDLMMPQMSGFELLKAIRMDEDLRYTPVIVLTAATGADAKLRALQLGATDFLAKPVDASELALRVRNTLAYQQYHRRVLHFDRVSGLPKRHMFERGFKLLLARHRPEQGLMALLSVTIPELRQFRQSLFENGLNAMIGVLAARLGVFLNRRQPGVAMNAAGEQSPRLARPSQDEFCLVLEGLESAEALELEVRALVEALGAPIKIDQDEFVVKAWIGISLYPNDGATLEPLYKGAVLAAAHALQVGMLPYEFASAELNAKSQQKLVLGNQLRNAAQRGELCLHYQPKVSLKTGQIVGLEALVRWQHPSLGLLRPVDFVPLAEEIGLIAVIGAWVIEQACRDAALWTKAGFGELKLAINVAKPQFTSGSLGETLRLAALAAGVALDRIVLELTESMLMDDVHCAVAQMHQLKALGLALSIDDFGTGYSSLSYLKRFPLDELKIDRSFVMDLPGAAADLAIVRAVVELGHNLGMAVIAEGVETEAQRDCLARLGCDSFQGYLFSHPVPAAQLLHLLMSQSAAADARA